MNNNDLTIPAGDGLLNVRVGAIIMKENKILMVGNERSDYFYSVGGRIKFGESAREAVEREVFEETGVKMEVDRLAFVHENFFVGDAPVNLGKQIYEISFFFYMKVPDEFEPVCNSFTEDNSEEHLSWISIDTDKNPEFFRDELKNSSKEVKYIISREW